MEITFPADQRPQTRRLSTGRYESAHLWVQKHSRQRLKQKQIHFCENEVLGFFSLRSNSSNALDSVPSQNHCRHSQPINNFGKEPPIIAAPEKKNLRRRETRQTILEADAAQFTNLIATPPLKCTQTGGCQRNGTDPRCQSVKIQSQNARIFL